MLKRLANKHFASVFFLSFFFFATQFNKKGLNQTYPLYKSDSLEVISEI